MNGLKLYTDQKNIVSVAMHNMKAVKEGRPLKFNHVFIDLARVCNLRCIGCFQFMDRNQQRMRLSFEEIKNTIDFAKERGARVAVIAGAGEPTLDPEFRKIIKYISDVGMYSVVFTNTTTLTPELVEFLYKNKATIILKMLSTKARLQDKIMQVPGISERIYRNIEMVLEVRKKLEREGIELPPLALDAYISRLNIDDIPNILRFCRKRGIIPYIETFITVDQGALGKELAPTQEEIDRLFEKLAEIDMKEFGIKTILKPGVRVYGGEPCMKGKAGFAVKVNGDVKECVSGRYTFGNIKERSLEEIFDTKSPVVKRYYSTPGCLGCMCSLAYKGWPQCKVGKA